MAVNVRKAGRSTAGPEAPVDLEGSESIRISWPLDGAPTASVDSSNMDDRRSNFFEGGDEWWLYVGRGEAGYNPAFIGTQPPNAKPENDDPITVRLQGYSALLSDAGIAIDRSLAPHALEGYELMAAVAELAAAVPQINTRGLRGTSQPLFVRQGDLARGVVSRMSAMKSVLSRAVDETNPANPRKWHWLEYPTPQGPTLLQVAEIDVLAASQPTAAVIDVTKDVLYRRRVWLNDVFNGRWWLGPNGEFRLHQHAEQVYGTVHSPAVAGAPQEALSSVEARRGNIQGWELVMAPRHFDLAPGMVVQVKAGAGNVDGFYQVTEVRIAASADAVRHVVRLASPVLGLVGLEA